MGWTRAGQETDLLHRCLKLAGVPSFVEALDVPLQVEGLARCWSTLPTAAAITFRSTLTIWGRAAILPEISGRAWVFVTRTTALDPLDPYPTGFVLSDVRAEGSPAEPDSDRCGCEVDRVSG